MDFDIGTVLNVVGFIFAHKLVLGGVVGLFVGWNLPQPAFAKTFQDKIVAGFSWVWSKFKKDEE